MSNKITVCIICKNEQEKISQCLDSVSWADEIVIIDSGSTDNTVEIAKKYTDKIFDYQDWPGFGKQRQRAEKHASYDWILAIDCDEVISPELKDEIQKQLTSISDNDVLFFNRLTHFCGKFIYHSGWYPSRIARIYNKTKFGYNDKLVHESVLCSGANKVHLKGNLLHYQFDDLFQYINKRNGYAHTGANEKYLRQKRGSLSKAVSASLFAFFRHYVLRLGVLDGRLGFVIAVIQMQYTFNKYLFLTFKK